MLLTNYTDGLDELFEIDKEIIVYDNKKDLLDKVEFFLENPIERHKIENFGYEKSRNNHTYFHRVQKFIEDL